MPRRVKRLLGCGAIVSSSLTVPSCVTRPIAPVRTIELPDPSEEQKGAELGSAPSDEPSGGSALIASGNEPLRDEEFVFSRRPSAASGAELERIPIHINDHWWPHRAAGLELTVAQARARDAAISSRRAPRNFWDGQTAVEALSVWTVLCNECHGGRRSLQDALDMPEPPARWSEGEGLFFGKRRAYEAMFLAVYQGGPKKEPGHPAMPAWKKILPKEVIWSLLYFLEYQSGGIESQFPPSLYPRRPKLFDGAAE